MPPNNTPQKYTSIKRHVCTQTPKHEHTEQNVWTHRRTHTGAHTSVTEVPGEISLGPGQRDVVYPQVQLMQRLLVHVAGHWCPRQSQAVPAKHSPAPALLPLQRLRPHHCRHRNPLLSNSKTPFPVGSRHIVF